MAEHYSTIYLPEFARGYLTVNGPEYSYETVVFIAEQQLLKQRELFAKGISPAFLIPIYWFVASGLNLFLENVPRTLFMNQLNRFLRTHF
ncbi:MAG: hypothetical protein R2850_09005 [Bacteroidia bacterium]